MISERTNIKHMLIICIGFVCMLTASCTEETLIDDGFYTIQGNGSQLSLIGPNNKLIIGNELTALSNSNDYILAEAQAILNNNCYYLLIRKKPFQIISIDKNRYMRLVAEFQNDGFDLDRYFDRGCGHKSR